MKKFTDSKGRAWEIDITGGAVARLRDSADVDLRDILNEQKPLFEQLYDDELKLCAVAWALCEPQAKAAGVSPEEFAAGMGGDALEGAYRAIPDDVTVRRVQHRPSFVFTTSGALTPTPPQRPPAGTKPTHSPARHATSHRR